MQFIKGLTRKKQSSSSASAETRKKEHDYYLENGSAVLEELLALCDGNCRIPIRYFTATDIERAIKHSENKLYIADGHMVTGSLDKRLVFIRTFPGYFRNHFNNIFRDIAITAQMSHLKNVLRLVGCCIEFEEPVMVYEYVEATSLYALLFEKDNHDDETRKSLLSWGSRLRIAHKVASAVVFLHTEFTTPIIHRDLKPSNVIVDQNSGVAKLLNFSLSVSLPQGKLEVVKDVVCGTYGYVAPEYSEWCMITQKIDVYSFGVILLQLLTRRNMTTLHLKDRDMYYIVDPSDSDFKMLNIEEIHVMDIADPAILEEHGIKIRQQLEDCWDLVKKCTAYKGEERPYMIEVAKELSRIHHCFRALTLCRN
ncbi:hypothetical protein T459_16947 [Capsicum annuum]|uniref:Protein kinase domain-containing protein n=1 Tax=Capsicum annuum TaxID=4072 RepID=A0A2G2ZAJ7_CAPAN|nr:serine/threonine-protein kinase ZRK1 [Capsicum annuum]KAF3644266.1 putative trehalose-phosphate phosphatase F-like [Capsicum annuum]PHT78895.1 hypothetical protein T459_16947 [Capsicum annuum]